MQDRNKSDFVSPSEEYWSDVWQNLPMPRKVEPHDRSIRNAVRLSHIRLLNKFIVPISNRQTKILELGCARSIWLPYFSKQKEFSVSGIDFSPLGCAQSRGLLENEGLTGQIYQADFFSPPSELIGKFDYVISFGLIEHFKDTSEALTAAAKFLCPGGTLLTLVPNMKFLPGWLQKTAQRSVFDLHVPLDHNDLDTAAKKAGLSVVANGYLMFSNFGAIFFKTNILSRMISTILVGFSALTWFLARLGIILPPNKYTSPYVYNVARK